MANFNSDLMKATNSSLPSAHVTGHARHLKVLTCQTGFECHIVMKYLPTKCANKLTDLGCQIVITFNA
ncbi:hypothetical protein PM8797T_02054, partial [Gimesia maris DSM 8797]